IRRTINVLDARKEINIATLEEALHPSWPRIPDAVRERISLYRASRECRPDAPKRDVSTVCFSRLHLLWPLKVDRVSPAKPGSQPLRNSIDEDTASVKPLEKLLDL